MCYIEVTEKEKEGKMSFSIFIFIYTIHLAYGTNKQYVAVLLLHNTTNHYQALYRISEF